MMQQSSPNSELGSPFTSLTSVSSSSSQFEEISLNGKKVFSCLFPDCGKIFHYKSEMKRHAAIHLDQRPYVCSFPNCWKAFKRSDALSNHYRIHTKKTSISCPSAACKSFFTTKSALRCHLLTHQGEKAFEGYSECPNQLSQHDKSSYYHDKIEQTITYENSNPLQQTEQPSFDDYKPAEKKWNLDFNECDEFNPLFFSNFMDFDFDTKLEATLASEGDAYRNSLPNMYNTKAEEKTFSEKLEISVPETKSGRNAKDTLVSLLHFMMEENQDLKKKLKYTTDTILKGDPTKINPTEDQYHNYYGDQCQEQDQNLVSVQSDIDLFFKSPFEFDVDENTEREFIF